MGWDLCGERRVMGRVQRCGLGLVRGRTWAETCAGMCAGSCAGTCAGM